MSKEEITLACDGSAHYDCDGYIAPLVYGDSKRCTCNCHAGLYGRDYKRAVRRAEKSHYGRAYYPEPVPHGSRT